MVGYRVFTKLCKVECAPHSETTVNVSAADGGGRRAGGGGGAVAAIRRSGVIGKVAGVPSGGNLVARSASNGGFGAIWGSGGGFGADQIAGALLAGRGTSSVRDWDDFDGQGCGYSHCGAAVSIDPAAIVNNWLVQMDIRASDAPARGGVCVLDGVGGGTLVATGTGQAQGVGAAAVGSGACMDG